MNKVIVLTLSLLFSVELSAQIVYPNFGAYVTRKNIRHAKDAHRALNEATIMKVKFNIKISAARDNFWKADSLGNITDELRDNYADLLYEKDMSFLMMGFMNLGVNKLIGSDLTEGIAIFDELTGGKIDGGILSHAEGAFNVWANKIYTTYDKETHKIDDTNLIIEIMARENVEKLYFDYIKKRDWAESIYKNNYTGARRFKEYEDAQAESQRKQDVKDPYKRKRALSSFEKFEKEISNKPMMDILNKYESRQFEFDEQGGLSNVVYDVAPYEPGDLLDFPEKMKARVIQFGTGERPKKSNFVKLTFYKVGMNNTRTKIKTQTFEINKLNKDVGFIVRMMQEGGIWDILSRSEHGELFNKSLHSYDNGSSSSHCWLMIELNEITN